MENSNQPIHPAVTYTAKGDEIISEHLHGLTKREYFAAMAMQGLINNVNSERFIAEIAVKIADELINQLEKTK